MASEEVPVEKRRKSDRGGITQADGTKLPISEVGQFSFLRDILVVPTLAYNLLSIASVVMKGFSVVFTRVGVSFYRESDFKVSGTPVLTGSKESGGLFVVDIEEEVAAKETEFAFLSDTKAENLVLLWHARLGHPCLSTLRHAFQNKLFADAGLTHFTKDHIREYQGSLCQACALGKMKMKPVNRKGADGVVSRRRVRVKGGGVSSIIDGVVSSRVKQVGGGARSMIEEVDGPDDPDNNNSPDVSESSSVSIPLASPKYVRGELVCIDLITSPNTSLHRFNYALTMIDAATRYIWAYPLVTKEAEEVDARLSEWMLDIARDGVQVACLTTIRSDNGGEFKNSIIKFNLNKLGVSHETCPPFGHVALIERANQTIEMTTRALLMHANVRSSFWWDAMRTAVHLINRLPTRPNMNATRYEAYFGRKPAISRLRMFGALCYVKEYDVNRTLWDPEASLCRFMGYGDDFNPSQPTSYYVYKVSQRRFLFTNNVVFNEELLAVQLSDSAARMHDEGDWMASTQSVPTLGGTSREEEEEEVGLRRITRSSVVSEVDVAVTAASTDSSIAPRIPQSLEVSEVDVAVPAASTDSGIAPPDPLFPSLTTEEIDVANALAARVLDSTERATPNTYSQAMASVDAVHWKEAIASEIDSLVKNSTLTVIPRGDSKVRALGIKWVFKIKLNKDGGVARYKARCTALGNLQREGIDYDETYAPVVRQSSLRLLLAVAVQNDMPVHQMDVDTAFLYGEFEQGDPEVYLTLPQDYPVPAELAHIPRKDLICRVNKGLYGLKQAPRLWNKKIDSTLQSHGFRRFKSDPCIYVRRSGLDTLYVGLYVDDLVLAGSTVKYIDVFKLQLGKVYNMKDLGPIGHLLGMDASQDLTLRTLTLSQGTYIRSILRRFSLEKGKLRAVPMIPGLQLAKGQIDDKPFPQMVGSLLYLTSCTRPDIAFAVNKLTRFISCHDQTHWDAGVHVCEYLLGTLNLGLKFRKVPWEDFTLKGFSDSDYASDATTRRSVTGYVFTMGSAPIAWRSKTQPTVALSSTEAEYMALGATVAEGLYLKRMVAEFGYTSVMHIFGDNMSSLHMVRNSSSNNKSKHIDVRHHFIRDHFASGMFQLEHLGTEDMVADMLTKSLAKVLHEKHRGELMN
jgi:hypothetical protein